MQVNQQDRYNRADDDRALIKPDRNRPRFVGCLRIPYHPEALNDMAQVDLSGTLLSSWQQDHGPEKSRSNVTDAKQRNRRDGMGLDSRPSKSNRNSSVAPSIRAASSTADRSQRFIAQQDKIESANVD
jgi:hypothetical protein